MKEDHIIEMAFDSFENRKFRDPDVLYPWRKEQIRDDGETYYLLLDEVQMPGVFESALNGFIRLKNVDIDATGSNAGFLSWDVITEFRGRGDEVQMHPPGFSEFMPVYPGAEQDGLNEYMLYGGLPQILAVPDPEQKSSFLKAPFEETCLSDIVGRHRIKNRAELEEIPDALSSSIGSLTSPYPLSSTFRSVKNKNISPSTVKNISILRVIPS